MRSHSKVKCITLFHDTSKQKLYVRAENIQQSAVSPWLILALTCQDNSWGSSHPLTSDMMHYEGTQSEPQTHTSVQWVYQLNLISAAKRWAVQRSRKAAGLRFPPSCLFFLVCLCSLTRDSTLLSEFKDVHNRLTGNSKLSMHEEYDCDDGC